MWGGGGGGRGAKINSSLETTTHIHYTHLKKNKKIEALIHVGTLVTFSRGANHVFDLSIAQIEVPLSPSTY